MKVNVGCGQTPIDGWRNFDNSPSLRLALLPLVPTFCCDWASSARPSMISWRSLARTHSNLPTRRSAFRWKRHRSKRCTAPTCSSIFLRRLLRVFSTKLSECSSPTASCGSPYPICNSWCPNTEKLATQTNSSTGWTFVIRCRLRFREGRPSGHRSSSPPLDVRWPFPLPPSGGTWIPQPRGHACGSTRIAEPGALNLHERSGESVYVEAERPAAS